MSCWGTRKFYQFKVSNFGLNSGRNGILDCIFDWYPKFYKLILSFVNLNTLGIHIYLIFIEFFKTAQLKLYSTGGILLFIILEVNINLSPNVLSLKIPGYIISSITTSIEAKLIKSKNNKYKYTYS